MSSSNPSSRICRRISSCIVSASEERLSRERKLDWCSTRLARSASSRVRVELCCRSESSSRRRRDRPSSVDRSGLLLLSRVLSEFAARRVSRRACARLSRRLSSWTSRSTLLSFSSSSLSSSSCGGGKGGKTDSPGLYRSAISSFSVADRARSGCAASTISSKVVTVAFVLVRSTSARQDGQVNREVSDDERRREP